MHLDFKKNIVSTSQVYKFSRTELDTIKEKSIVIQRVTKYFFDDSIQFFNVFQNSEVGSVYGQFNKENYINSYLIYNHDTILLEYDVFLFCKSKTKHELPILFEYNEVDNIGGNYFHKVENNSGNKMFLIFSGGPLACNGSGCFLHYYIIIEKNENTVNGIILPMHLKIQ